MLSPVLVCFLMGACFAQVTTSRFDDNFTEVANNHQCDDCGNNPDKYLNTPQIVRRHGYASESHIVETEDGYLLTLHRIPSNVKGRIGNQPVFLQHGLLSSSAHWVISGNKSLAFMLSDVGYDVWLGNARGNTYSKGHASLVPDSNQFWNFSFHEMGVYDLPAALNHVSNVTGKRGEIIYIGHSMGTTMFYVLASMLPEFANSAIKMMAGLAPVAYTTHMKSPIRFLGPFDNDLQWIAEHLGIREFLPHGNLMKFLSYDCELLKVEKEICEKVIFAICGFDQDQLEDKMLPIIFAHTPAGSSVKTLIHYAQEIHHDGDFKEFDYGKVGNIIKYGTPTPPLYNLSNIDVPTYFMYADNDWLANPIDVGRLARKVSNNRGLYKVPLENFNHIDFLWAKDAPKLVYKNLIKIIERYAMCTC